MEGVLVVQETEVLAKAQRRRFRAAEKMRVLREADRCTKPISRSIVAGMTRA